MYMQAFFLPSSYPPALYNHEHIITSTPFKLMQSSTHHLHSSGGKTLRQQNYLYLKHDNLIYLKTAGFYAMANYINKSKEVCIESIMVWTAMNQLGM